jgi:hypothetical protein
LTTSGPTLRVEVFIDIADIAAMAVEVMIAA